MFPAPAPRIAKPECWQNVQVSRLRSAVESSDADENIIGTSFGIFDKNIEVAILTKDACIEQLIFGHALAALTIGFNQISVRKCALRIFIQHLHIRMGWRGIKIKIVFFHILAMIALRASQAKETFFENSILPIPERKRETQTLLIVADASQSILIPTINA